MTVSPSIRDRETEIQRDGAREREREADCFQSRGGGGGVGVSPCSCVSQMRFLRPFKLDEGFLWKIRLHETGRRGLSKMYDHVGACFLFYTLYRLLRASLLAGHSILLATGLRKLVDQGLHEAKARRASRGESLGLSGG